MESVQGARSGGDEGNRDSEIGEPGEGTRVE